MKVTPNILLTGSILVWATSISIMVVFPVITTKDKPSDIFRPMTKQEAEGHKLYVSNGCSYCHSLYIRQVDWGKGAERIAQPGDYYGQNPAILGSERTGPDLSQEGGEHPDDWHLAHFINPRFTSPVSLMPSWQFLGKDKIEKLTSYVQYLGGKNADVRVERQKKWKKEAVEAYSKTPDENVEWIHNQVPDVWRNMPNPYPSETADLERGKNMFFKFCITCHGPVGDGNGQAAKFLIPKPLNFTILRRHLQEKKYIGGILYYQIMNGITGTAMPYFKRDLESEKIWDLSNYVAVYFMSYTDGDIEPKGIDASYEPDWNNEYKKPDSLK